jgi:hypothetical protein
MARFEKFDAGKQISGLAEAVRQIAKEERESQKNDKDVEFNFGANVKRDSPTKAQ